MLDFAGLFAVRHSRGQIPQSKCLGRPQSPNPLQIFCDSDDRDGQTDAQKSNALVTTRLIQVVQEQDENSRSGVHVMLFIDQDNVSSQPQSEIL